MDHKTTLSTYIKQEIMRNPNARLQETDDLLSAGILDSLAILQLVAFVEESFKLRIPDEDVVFENFQSIDSLDKYLATLKQ
jgi:acyl carrier protein